MSNKIIAALLSGLAVGVVVSSAYADPLEPYLKGKVIQRLNAFDNPEGSIFSADGKYVFVSNSAELGMPDKGFHWTHKGGYISKLAVQPDGTLKMVNEKLITGLDRALGYGRHSSVDQEVPEGHDLLDRGVGPSSGRRWHRS